MVTRAGPAMGALSYGATAVLGLRLPVLLGCLLGLCAAALAPAAADGAGAGGA